MGNNKVCNQSIVPNILLLAFTSFFVTSLKKIKNPKMFWEPPRLLQFLVHEIRFFSHLTLIYSVLIFLIFSSDRKDCQLICKVFTLFHFFLDNFSSFFVLELCSFSLGKNVTQGILLYQIFLGQFFMFTKLSSRYLERAYLFKN